MLGLRLNVWTSIVLFLLAAAYFVVVGRRHPDREESVFRDGLRPGPTADAVPARPPYPPPPLWKVLRQR